MKRRLCLGIYLFYVPVSQSLCEVPNNSKNTCEDYNSIYRKMRGGDRHAACMAVKGCKFVGKGWNGSCVPVHTLTSKRSSNVDSSRAYSLLLSQESNTSAGAIEILMKEKITSSVADTIIESHDAAHEVSKELVIEVLNDKDNVSKMATALSNAFGNEDVLSPIRDFTYYYLHTDDTIRNINWLLHGQMRYFFKGHGKIYTEAQLINLFIWWTDTPHFKETIFPLINWAIRDKEVSIEPLASIVVDALKYREKIAAEALSSYVSGYLDSNETKSIVKEQISNLLVQKFSSNKKTPSGPEEEMKLTLGGERRGQEGIDENKQNQLKKSLSSGDVIENSVNRLDASSSADAGDDIAIESLVANSARASKSGSIFADADYNDDEDDDEESKK